MIETLLLNFLFLILPIIIYLVFFEDKHHTFNRWMYSLFATISMVLCMSHPIHLQLGFIFDLRYIPFFIIALYSGHKYAFPLYIVLNLFRFYIGGEGTLNSFLTSTIVFLFVPFLKNMFLTFKPKNRLIFSAGIITVFMGIYLILLSLYFEKLTSEFIMLSIYAVTTHAALMGVIIILIEKIILNIRNRERYISAERLNVVSELSASVSHEIRNPLTVTSGFLQLLGKSKTIGVEEKRYLDLSLQELKRAEKIVSDYLSFAKPQSENMVYSNLEEEAEYTKNLIIPYAAMHQVEVQYSFYNTLKTSYDRNQLQQCFINLFKNSIEAMKPNGGILSIAITEVKNDIIITINDSGIGMTSDEINRLGKPYFSTKEEGTGLGMLMVYSTINKVKGTINVKSKKGKGTTFIITIPT
ncbi:GHKL domain-containing protein [Sutcliffiella horikoshii]|uniref:histidine kinase n=1 Tax=Sutcliffiella horikoshii TaxID=79883 RepID=A0A5D4T1N2_9BACI|nr:GHKL domain-containing protein [Sutcliffiella horikoshii]